jgi:hypothetical protein
LTENSRPPQGQGDASAPSAAPEDYFPDEIKEPTLPPENDPKAQADFFMEMLDTFAKANTAETKRIRQALIDAIDTYAADYDKVRAGEVLKATLAGIEIGMAEVLRRILARVRDRMREESKRLGVTTPDGDLARRGAEGFTLVVQAMNKLVQSEQLGDENMREQAHAILAQAQKKIESVVQSGESGSAA